MIMAVLILDRIDGHFAKISMSIMVALEIGELHGRNTN